MSGLDAESSGTNRIQVCLVDAVVALTAFGVTLCCSNGCGVASQLMQIRTCRCWLESDHLLGTKQMKSLLWPVVLVKSTCR